MRKYLSIFFLFAFLGISVFGNFIVLENQDLNNKDVCMTVLDQKISCQKDTSSPTITPTTYTTLFIDNSYNLEKNTSNPNIKEKYLTGWLALHENSPTAS